MKKAFTLIELIVTMSIVGILATIAIPIYEKMILKSRVEEAKATIQSIIFAQERYKQETGDYFPAKDSFVQNENNISKTLKVDLSKSNNFNYFITRVTNTDSLYNSIVNNDSNFTIKAVLRGWDLCTDDTSATPCKQSGAENVDSWVEQYTRKETNHYILFRYPNKLSGGDYIDNGVDYEKLYYEE
jgi:prepilin-type N-terminal cleavage/methylation domain-containing protein